MPYADQDSQRAYQREWYRRRRADWLAEHGPCASCGSWEDLHVDHVDPGVKVSHRLWSWSTERRAAELAKCQVLCLTCHDEKTRAEGGGGIAPRHGALKRYRKGCRCVECKAANAAYGRRRRAAARAGTSRPTP